MKIFVGNLPFLATENDVKGVFEAFGIVASVSIKKKSGKNSRGFGFVSMPDDLQAQAAITGLQDKEFMGRPLSVSMERPKPVKPKKDYKAIKKLRLEAKKETPAVFVAPVILEKKVKPNPKVYKEFEKEDKPSRKFREDAKKFAEPAGAQAWEKRKGRGTAKPWKKKPGGVNKKFKYAR
jgi:RNA recognition motif-containing protein